MIDYSKLRKKLVPEPDGQDVLRLRVGIVTAINANGTCDVTVAGTTVPNVSRLQEATVSVGAVVQMLSYRGAMLIIGRAASSSQSTGLGLWTRGQSYSSSSSITSSTPVTTGLVTDTVTFVKNRVYEVRTHGGVTNNAANTYADLRPYRTAAATQLGEYFRFATPVASVVFNATGGGIYFTPANDVSGSVTLYGGTGSGTMNHYAAAGAPRNIEVWDVGDISKFTGIQNW